MGVTRLKRKERRNKTTARVRVENIKLNKSRIFIKSPYADESGIIIDDTNTSEVAAPVMEEKVAEVTPEVEANNQDASTEEE